MSHCTNFEFQYTDRKLILEAFRQLGLRCEDGMVGTSGNIKWRTDEYTLLGTKRPAILAKKNGFNYMMENMGNHYELSIEKHQMTSSDWPISKQMGQEFQKIYVKCAAEMVMKQMEQKGQSCFLEEVNGGFEIKFGLMYEKSLLVKLENGRVLESVRGVKGQSCQSITEALENMLSSADVELNTEWTEEYYEPDDGSALKVYDLG